MSAPPGHAVCGQAVCGQAGRPGLAPGRPLDTDVGEGGKATPEVAAILRTHVGGFA